MKLLYDENLPRSLVRTIADLYPESTHVVFVGLESADDDHVWEFAAQQGFTVVSKDADFHERSSVLGHPPKVVWIRRGNCTTGAIADLLRESREELLQFKGDDTSLLVLE